MEWLRANYDRAALMAAGLFLLGCAAGIFSSVRGFHERFSAMEETAAPNDRIPSGRAAEIIEATHRLEAPPQWTFSGRSGLFVPEKHFLGANGQPTTLQSTVLHPPVPNEWLEEFGLSITDADVLTQDPDGDGFTNLDEWEGHSNPIEKDSHASYLSKLRLKSFAQEKFPLIFSSSTDGTFGINSLDQRRPTQFLKVGDRIAGTKFRVAAYTEKYDIDRYGTTIDVSELSLEQLETHERVTLVKEKTATSPQSVAHFLYSWGGTERTFPVRKDQEFSLKPEEQVRYKLLDVQTDKAIIVNTKKPDEKIEIRGVKA